MLKRTPYRNKKILDAAKGEACTINSTICNYDPETTVFMHLNESYAGKGGGQKADDHAGAFGCSACHDYLDGRRHIVGGEAEKDWYWLRGMYRTIRRLFDLGVLS